MLLARTEAIVRVAQAGPTVPAVASQLERGVSRRFARYWVAKWYRTAAIPPTAVSVSANIRRKVSCWGRKPFDGDLREVPHSGQTDKGLESLG